MIDKENQMIQISLKEYEELLIIKKKYESIIGGASNE